MRLHSILLLSGLLAGCAPPPNLGGDESSSTTDPSTPPQTGDSGSVDSSGGGGGEGDLDPAQLDRSEAEGACGYPGPGPAGYGTEVGQRVANNTTFILQDCEGQSVQLADFFCPVNGKHNRGILINIGAGWCGPCQEETLEFPELYDEYRNEGIEIVQVMFQDWEALAPTSGFCSDWSSGQWSVGGSTEDQGIDLEFPVLLDQIYDWSSIYLQDPQSSTPINMLIDANGNIRWKLEGQKPPIDVLRAQFDLVISEPYAPPS